MSWKSEIGFTHLFYPNLPWKQKKIEKIHVFFHFLAKKTKNQPSRFRPGFQKGLVQGKYENHWHPLRESIVIKCTNLFPNFQRGTLTQKTKFKAKIWKLSIFLPSLIYEKIQCLIKKLKFGSDMPLTYRDLHTKFQANCLKRLAIAKPNIPGSPKMQDFGIFFF